MENSIIVVVAAAATLSSITVGEIFPTSAKLGKEPSLATVVIIEMAPPDLAQDPKDLIEPSKEKKMGADRKSVV